MKHAPRPRRPRGAHPRTAHDGIPRCALVRACVLHSPLTSASVSRARALVCAQRRYYEYFYSRKSAMDEDDILANLAPSLRREVTSPTCSRRPPMIVSGLPPDDPVIIAS